MISKGEMSRRALIVWVSLIIIFLYAPVAVVALGSLNKTEVIRFPITEYSLSWYVDLFNNRQIGDSVIISLIVGTLTSVISTIIGVPLAVGINKHGSKTRQALSAICAIPMMTPTLLLGIALLNLFVALSYPLSLSVIVLGHVVMTIPFVVLVVGARYVNMDRSVEEASWDLGAGKFQTFVRVVIPSLRPAIFSAFLITFTLSFDEPVISFFLSGTETTLPVLLWSMLRFGISPEINALATITLIVSLFIAIVAQIATNKQANR